MAVILDKDKRVRNTKEKFYDALIEMMKEAPLAEISVKDLCQRARLNRATFYRHYQDVYMMKDEMEANLTREFKEAIKTAQPLESYHELRLFCLRVLHFIVAHQDECILIFRQNNSDNLFHKFQNILVETFSAPRDHSNKLDQFGLIFIFSGIVNVLQAWLEGKRPVTVEALVEYIIHCIQNGFHCVSEPEEVLPSLEEIFLEAMAAEEKEQKQ